MNIDNAPPSNPYGANEQAGMPFVSVLLAVRNEAGYIGECLRGLGEQDYPHQRFEVLLIDGESTDGTVAEALDAVGDLSVSFLNNPGRTAPLGLNIGLSRARGEVIVKVDGHTSLAPDFLRANVRALQQTGADATGGAIETRGRGVIGRAIALAMSSPFGIGDASFRHADAVAQWTDSVPYGAYRREVFERIGPFADIDRGEDDELNYRLRRAGGRIWLSPEVRSVYYCRGDYASLARQYWSYGRAKAEVLRRHPGSLRARHLVPSVLVLALAGGTLLSRVDGRFGWLAALAAASYTAVNLAATLRIAGRGHTREAPYLPAAFACIHLPAGAGLIAGCLRGLFQRRRGRADAGRET